MPFQSTTGDHCARIFVTAIDKVVRHPQKIRKYVSPNKFLKGSQVTSLEIVSQSLNDANHRGEMPTVAVASLKGSRYVSKVC